MKALTLSVLALCLCHPALAAFSGGQKLASVNQLTADAAGFGQMTEIGEGCRLSVKRIAGGTRIGMASEEAGYAWLDVRYDSAVLLTESHDEDGTYTKVYEVPGQGKLTAVFADDSYLHVYMETHGKTVSCEVDY